MTKGFSPNMLKQYRDFRKKYEPFLRAAKREMQTSMQRNLVDVIAATAFGAGYNAEHTDAPPIKPKGWKAGVDRRL